MNSLEKMLLTAMICTQSFMYNLVHDEDGAVDLVTVVVLIGIAVVLAIVFRGALSELLDTLMNTIKGNASNAVAQ